MSYAQYLRETFVGLAPVGDDLFLLEAHQIALLSDRAPQRELAALLHVHPNLHRFPGRVAFAVAPLARHVFAVEPVATLRDFVREKATSLRIGNLFVLDGLLSAIPLPARIVNALLTYQAIGWDLAPLLAEVERVVKEGGTAMHMLGGPGVTQSDNPLLAHGYRSDIFENGDVRMIRYWKQIGISK